MNLLKQIKCMIVRPAHRFLILMHSIRRGCLAYLKRHGFNTRFYAILGANPLGYRLKTAISEMPWLGYNFVGFFDDRSESEDRRLGSDQIDDIKGGFDQLLEQAKSGMIDHVYIT